MRHKPGNVAQDGSDGHSPYTKALAATLRQPGLDIFQTFNQVGLAVKRETGGSQQPWVSSSPIDGTFYFVAPASQPTQAALSPPANPLRADPDRIPLTDPALLRELSERLYEHNFDPEKPDGTNDITRAITIFQERVAMTPTGEPTEGVLRRLR
jgi:Caspase domain